MPSLLRPPLVLLALIAVFFWMTGAAEAQQPGKRLFGSIEFIGGSLSALPQWTRVLERIKKEQRTYDTCTEDAEACPFPAVSVWQAKLKALKKLPENEQLAELNAFLNRWIYRLDPENFGLEDYWATPLEFLRLSGDCEDYAIIKYVSLRALGYAADRLRIVVVRDRLRNIAHAVLAVYTDDDILIMDSLFDGVLSHRQVTFYSPQYSVNEKRRWAHIMPMPPRPASKLGASRP